MLGPAEDGDGNKTGDGTGSLSGVWKVEVGRFSGLEECSISQWGTTSLVREHVLLLWQDWQTLKARFTVALRIVMRSAWSDFSFSVKAR